MLTTVEKPTPSIECNEHAQGRRAWINGQHIDENPYPPAKGCNWKRQAWFNGYLTAKYEWRFGK